MDTLFNSEFEANNVFTLSFPKELTDSINNSVNNPEIFSRLLNVQPKWNSDISWLSPNTLHDFKLFMKFLAGLILEM